MRTLRSRFSRAVEVQHRPGCPATVVILAGHPGDDRGFLAMFFPGNGVLPPAWSGFTRGKRADTFRTMPPATVLRRLGLATAVCPDCSAPLARDCAGCPACPHGPEDRLCDNCAPDETPYDAASPDPDPWFQSPGNARRNGSRAP